MLSVFFKIFLKSLFMSAELFFAVYTGKAHVCLLMETLRIKLAQHFPVYKQDQRHDEKRCVIFARYKYHRCKHHDKVPVVYTACAAALVFHHPLLERTEEQDTYHVADGIRHADTEKNSFTYHTEIKQCSDSSIKGYPAGSYYSDRMLWRYVRKRWLIAFCRRLIIFSELFLTSHAFKTGWEEAQQHFNGENDPNEWEEIGVYQKCNKVGACLKRLDAVNDINSCCGKKESSAKQQLPIMQ